MPRLRRAPSFWDYSRGFYACSFEPAWREAETYFQKAILINDPRSPLARRITACSWHRTGVAKEAVAQTMLVFEQFLYPGRETR